MPRDLRRRIDAAWMLRKPNSGFNDVEAAVAAVAELLRNALVPDMPVVATLVSSAIRCQRPGVVMPIYATAQRPQGVPASAMMDLAILRALLGKKHPRIHYDVLGLLVRSGDLGNALLVVSSIRSRQMIHLLLSLWASQHPRDVRGISRIVRVALSTLDGQLLHSTHHLAISSILSSPHGRSSATMLVDRALAVHRVMAPRLESPSLAAVNQLMRAAMEQKMYSHVFAVYRDAESRPKWLQPGAQFANGAIMATLGECLARHLDMRSIATLTSVVTRSHIHAAPPFYTAIISGLVARPTKHDRHVLLRRVQVAEAILRTMGRCGIARPPKALYSIMYARAVLGQAWKTLRLFCRLDEKDVGEVAWGILMYAYVRRGDVRRTLEVLVRARKWLQTADVSVLRSKQMNTTSYLVNMAVSVLVNSGNQDSALSLLDMCLARSSESIKELSATPGDPITLGLIVRALLASQRFMQAVHVYDDALDQFGVRETPGLLRLFLQHCLGRGDGSNALRIAQRMVQLAGTLSKHEWLLLIQYLEEDAEQVLTVYQMWCRQLGVDGVVRVPNAVIQDPELARRIHASLEWGGHVAEAAEFAYRWQQRKCMDGKLYIADCPYGSYCPGGTYDCVYVDSQKKVSRKKYDFYQDIVYESLH
ncbi:hypothetical protein IWW51_000055 [Coemansia sp. RSA 2702]|nr:hypothetical protein IWW51_000055 [Coemansia sp. RSA 2702]